ncbi:MAG TPA: glycosyltransferase family 4 protein [Candidatus Limnocylindrales bacterium]|nr:glycosyltransferase family 4 protein [Candidatus Limnocylindrales bacterium]
MGKFRLAIFNTQPPQLYFGGVETRIIETTKRLTDQADITVYSGTKAGFKKPSIINGVNFVPCHSTDRLFPLDNWVFNRSISKKASSFEADVFEAHTVSGYGLSEALKKQGIKKPFIQTIHGVLEDEYEQARQSGYKSFRERVANFSMHRLAKLEEEAAKNATLVVTISNYSLEKIRQLYGVEELNIRVVPNGVDPEKFKPFPNSAVAKRQFGLDDEPCVLFVGSLIPRKGLSFLVEAAEKIVKKHAETKFMIVGEGPLKNWLLGTLEAAHLYGNFKFLGNVKEGTLVAAYNCADLLVLPSIQEGQGIVLLEAEASAKPVVAFNVGGVNEAVRDGETGLLVNRGDTDELADAVMKLLSDKGLSEEMGANARAFVSENFTWDLCARRMLQVYHEALARQG